MLSLESEASKLQELQELLYATAAAAERQAFMASPRSLPVHFSLPATRELGVNKCRIALLQLQQGALQAIVDAVRQLEPTPPRVPPPTPLYECIKPSLPPPLCPIFVSCLKMKPLSVS